MRQRDTLQFELQNIKYSSVAQSLILQMPLLNKTSQKQLKYHSQIAHQVSRLADSWKIRKTNCIDNFYHKYDTLIEGHFVPISLQSDLLLVWNILMYLIIFYYFLEIPIIIFMTDAVYFQIFSNQYLSIIYYLIIDLFVIDMLIIRTRVSYIVKGQTLTKNSDILRYYISNFLITDFIGLVVLIIYIFVYHTRGYFKIIFYMKVFSFKEISQQIKERVEVNKILNALFQSAKLIFFIVFATNLYACFYFAIDFFYYKQKGEFYQNGFLWLNGSISLFEFDIFETFGWKGSYIYALFWAMQTSRTCGYGVATPRNYVQVFYCNIVILTLICLFSFFANGVMKTISEYGAKDKQKIAYLCTVINVRDQFDITKALDKRLKNYISQIDTQTAAVENLMQRRLSEYKLKQFKLAFNINLISIIETIQSISLGHCQQFLFKKDLSMLIKNKYSHKDEIIYQSKNKVERASLYLVEKGSFCLENDEFGYTKQYNQWSIIGKRQFYLGGISIFTVRAMTRLWGLQLQFSAFKQCLQKYPIFFQRYNEIIQDIIINKRQTRKIYLTCIFCQNFHLDENCDQIKRWNNEINTKNCIIEDDHQTRTFFTRKTPASKKISNYCIKQETTELVYKTEGYYIEANIY